MTCPTPKSEATVVVIDDSAATRERTCALIGQASGLRAIGCTATQAGFDALLAEHRPSFVVIDAPARNLDGFEMLAAVRSLLPAALVIAMLHLPTPECLQHAIDSGADHAFVKSNDFELVADLVQSLSRGHER